MLCCGKRDTIAHLSPHDLRVVVGNKVELEARGAQWDRVTLDGTLGLTESQVCEDFRSTYDSL